MKVRISVSVSLSDSRDDFIAGLKKLGIVFDQSNSGSRGSYFIDGYKSGAKLRSKNVVFKMDFHHGIIGNKSVTSAQYQIKGPKGTVDGKLAESARPDLGAFLTKLESELRSVV